jgi:hypothetical protein
MPGWKTQPAKHSTATIASNPSGTKMISGVLNKLSNQ